MDGGTLNSKKLKVANKIRHYSKEDADVDLDKLIDISPPMKKDLTKLIGNKYLDYFFFPYRLDTLSAKGISFYNFIEDKELHKKKYIKSMIKNHTDNGDSVENGLYSAFSMYYGAINSFKPINASYIYGVFEPTSVLDFSSGWGGRLLGAVIYPNIHYTGFDTNIELRKPYKQMIDDLGVKDRAKVIFKDSSKVDYSKYNYDMVFTSPPYFIEGYEHQPDYKSYDDFVIRFLNPVVTNTYKYMKSGYYILNIPKNMYEDVKKILGKADMSFQLNMRQRNLLIKGKKQSSYGEKIYVWEKS